jgi:hypothetical protein
VTKAKDPEKGGKMAGSKGKKSSGVTGHYARNCEKRKGVEKALVTTAADEDGKEENSDE